MVTLNPGPAPKPSKPARGRTLLARNRELCLRRDGYRCRRCLKPATAWRTLEADHIVNRSQGGSDELDNLQTLCRSCHRWKTEHPEQALRDGWTRRGGAS